jgi:hypothetical protein
MFAGVSIPNCYALPYLLTSVKFNHEIFMNFLLKSAPLIALEGEVNEF